jgi:Family of unknown function (DUF6117)
MSNIAIPAHHKANFKTMCDALNDGNLAMMSCTRVVDGLPATVLCAVNREGPDYVFVPIAVLCDHPYADFLPATFEES